MREGFNGAHAFVEQLHHLPLHATLLCPASSRGLCYSQVFLRHHKCTIYTLRIDSRSIGLTMTL